MAKLNDYLEIVHEGLRRETRIPVEDSGKYYREVREIARKINSLQNYVGLGGNVLSDVEDEMEKLIKEQSHE